MESSVLKIIKSKLGVTKKGSRIWIEGKKLNQAGFSAGSEYLVDDINNSLTLRLTDGVGRKVSSRRKSPVIDITGQWVTDKFSGFTHLKIIIMKGLIRVKPDIIAMQIKSCRESIRGFLDTNQPIPYIDIFTGGSTSSVALNHGSDGKLKTAMHIECDPFYSDLSDQNHPDSISYNARIEDVDLDDIPEVPIVTAYWPCTCFSSQGRAKKGLAGTPELGDTGHLYHYVLEIIRKSQANIFIGECVPNFQNSYAAKITRKVLSDLGFDYVDEAILKAPDYGDLTRRERFVFAASRLGPIKLPRSVPYVKRRLLDILDKGEHSWLTPDNSRTMDYLVNTHSAKHQEKGNGFGLLGATHLESDEFMPTISRTYAKIQPSALLRKGPDIDAWRLFTPAEVQRAHGIPEDALILPESNSRKYEVLGQGTCFGMFSAIGKMLVKHLDVESKKAIDSREKCLRLFA